MKGFDRFKFGNMDDDGVNGDFCDFLSFRYFLVFEMIMWLDFEFIYFIGKERIGNKFMKKRCVFLGDVIYDC